MVQAGEGGSHRGVQAAVVGAETPVAVGCSQQRGQGTAVVEVLAAAMEVAWEGEEAMAAMAVGTVGAGCSRPWAQAAAAVVA